MIKMYAVSKDDSPDICFLGLEPVNIERIKKNEPIVIRLKELGSSLDISFAICFSDGKTVSYPRSVDGVLALNDEVISKLNSGSIVEVNLMASLEVSIALITSNADFEDRLRKSGLISENTIVRHEGMSPSDIPVNLN